MIPFDLYGWALEISAPSLPKTFELYPMVRVTDSAKWLGSIKADINTPKRPRAKHGALQADLKRLFEVVHEFSGTQISD